MSIPTQQTLNEVLQLFSPPDYVRSATAEQLYPPTGSARGLYGDPVSCSYPCHNKAAAWLSMARHLREKHDNAPRADLVRGRIKQAMTYFKNGAETERLEKQAQSFASFDSSTLTDEDYALVFDTPAGKERHYRLLNAGEVKQAGAYLRQYGPHFTFDERCQFARKILAKAAAFHVTNLDEDGWLTKQAGRGFCSGADAAALLFERASILRQLRRAPEDQEKLAMLARACLESPQFCHKEGNLVKCADWVDQIDRAYRLDRLNLTPPEDIFFGLSYEKMASMRSETVATASGAVYRREDVQTLLGLSEEKLAEKIGSRAAARVHQNGLVSLPTLQSIIEEMPRDAADRFEKESGLPMLGRLPAAPVNRLAGHLDELAALPV